MGYIKRNGISYLGDNAVELTQAQYDALVQAGTIDPATTYYVSDGIPSNPWRELINIVYPVGSIYISVSDVNPGTWMTGTTWEAFANGRTLVGVDTTDTDFDTVEETGGAKTVTLTSAQSGCPSHAHTYTRPTVSSSGAITNGITGGSHNHSLKFYSSGSGGGAKGVAYNVISNSYIGGDNAGIESTTHTHNLPNHTHTLTGGGVANNTATDAVKAHTNLQPYITTYMWKRVS